MERPARKVAGRERRSPTPAAGRKREAIRHLKDALARGRLCLHYQPIVGVRDGAVFSAEALLRWCDAERDEGAIHDLIAAAEHSPVIFRLENWTLREGFRAAAGWRDAGLRGVRVNVNLSAREFPRGDLAGRVKGHLASAGLDPTAVTLEVTETSAIHEFGAVAGHLESLIGMGMELWLDDFGTGHSSLEWLSHLPLHGVKLAATFVERLHEERCRTIVARVIEMAHDLGLRVAAEGVETPAQRSALAALGCDRLQGFLLHPALPAAELPALFASHAGASPVPSA